MTPERLKQIELLIGLPEGYPATAPGDPRRDPLDVAIRDLLTEVARLRAENHQLRDDLNVTAMQAQIAASGLRATAEAKGGAGPR